MNAMKIKKIKKISPKNTETLEISYNQEFSDNIPLAEISNTPPSHSELIEPSTASKRLKGSSTSLNLFDINDELLET